MKAFRFVLILFMMCGLFFTGCSNAPETNQPITPTGGLQGAPLSTETVSAAAAAYAQDVEKLLADLRSGNTNKIKLAVIALGKLKEKQAVEPLIELLALDDLYVREYIAEALGEIKDERAIEPLSVFLQDAQLCSTAAKAIGIIGGEKAVLVLADAFEGDQYDNLLGIAEGLAATNSPKAEQILIDALNTKGNHENLRRSAAEKLGAFKDEAAVNALVAIYTEYSANDAAAQFASTELKRSASIGLKALGADAVQPLLNKLDELTVSPDTSYEKNCVRESIIYKLGDIGDQRAVQPLISILKDKEDICHTDAANALGMIKDPRALQPLIDAFNESLALFHQYAHPQGDEELLKQTISNADFSACTGALVSLGGDQAISLLVSTSYDGEDYIRWQMARVLCDMNHPLVKERFNRALEEEDIPVIAGASFFFIYLGKPGSEPLLIKALEEYGDQGMLNGYLNCGNQQLSDAARTWAADNNYGIINMPIFNGNDTSTQWGAGQ